LNGASAVENNTTVETQQEKNAGLRQSGKEMEDKVRQILSRSNGQSMGQRMKALNRNSQ